MTVRVARGLNDSLINGATDGSFKKIRPDTEATQANTDATMARRQFLFAGSPYADYYGNITQESRVMQEPTGRRLT